MINGTLQLTNFGFGIVENNDLKILVLKDMNSPLTIQIPMNHEQFENFAGKLREERIIQATVIPEEPKIEDIKR